MDLYGFLSIYTDLYSFVYIHYIDLHDLYIIMIMIRICLNLHWLALPIWDHGPYAIMGSMGPMDPMGPAVGRDGRIEQLQEPVLGQISALCTVSLQKQ